MTRLFKNIFLLTTLFLGAMINASCPPNYTTYSTTLTDSNGNTIFYSICLPSVVSLTVNSGQFNIYITIQNQGPNISTAVSMCSFIPFDPIFTTIGGIITSNPLNTGTLSTTANVCTGNGRGQFNFASGIVSGGTATATLTVQALSAGSFSYQANVIAQNGQLGSLFPSITVEASCPTITASNGIGATACSNGFGTGNLYNFVTGGNSPYTFASAGNVNGTVSINNAGIYTFTPSVAGPTNGSFNYQAADIAGCLSNTGTITVPIVPGPLPGNDAFYTTTFGTPVINTLNFTGGTAPFTITTNNIVNGSVLYDSNTAQFTFTQTAPGASFFDYTVTDANGCTLTDTPNIYIYSCSPGFVASANLFNNVIYAICAPATVTVGSTFEITATFVNPNPVGLTPTVFPLDDLVPDPSQGPTYVPGLLYVSNDGVPVGTTFTSMGINFGQGGMGSFAVTGSLLPPTTSFSITMNILATASGPQTYNARVPSNPSFTLPVNIDVLPCPSITGGSTGIQSCNNEVTGNLQDLVVGGSGPYSFSQTGAATCGSVGISPSGAFTYTAPVGFTGPCSFDYVATDINGCVSSTGTVTITANLGPIASGNNIFICENTTLQASLSASDGTPPYTFSIVTNGTLGTATITDATLGTFEYVPNPNTFGNDFFTFQVTDSAGCVSNIAQYNIGILEAPNTTQLSLTACVNSPVSGDLAPLVTGGSPPYAFSQTGLPVGGNVIIGATGPFTFTPFTGFTGVGGFQYLVTDTQLCTSTGGVDITFASPIAGNTAINDCVNGTVNGSLVNLVTGGNPPYSYAATGGSVGGAVTINPSGAYSFVANTGFSGTGGFGYQVTDSLGCIGTAAIEVLVSSPIAGNTAVRDCVGGSVSGNLSSLVSSGFPPYTFGLTGSPVGGDANVNSGGIYFFTASPGFTGNGGFTYEVTDNLGCLSTGSVDVTVSSPIAGNTAARDCVNGSISGTLTGLVNSGFPPYTFGLTGAPVGGSANVNPNGTYTFTANPGFTGNAGFTYQVTDSIGCFDTGSVDVTVSSPIASNTAINLCYNSATAGDLSSLVTSGFPPYVFGLTGSPVGGSATVSSTGLYTFNTNTGFSGPGGFVYQVTDTNACLSTGQVAIEVGNLIAQSTSITICNDILSSNLQSLVSGGVNPLIFTGPLSVSCTGSSVSISATGNYTYTSPSGFTGPCNFVYQVDDALGCSSTGNVTIIANTAPRVNNGTLVTCENTAVTDSLAPLVVGNPPPPLTFAIVSQPTNGTLTSFNATTGAYTYTPNANFSGNDSFTFTVTDSGTPPCTTNIGTVTITVNPNPVVVGSLLIPCANQSISDSLAGLVQGNPPQPLTFALVSLPQFGTITNFNPSTGAYTYTPNTDYIGLDGFTFQVTDGNGCVSNTGIITIDVILCCPLTNDPLMQLILELYGGMTGAMQNAPRK